MKIILILWLVPLLAGAQPTAFQKGGTLAEREPVPLNLEQLQVLAEHPQWRRLMHYRKRTFGGYKSEVDQASFFLSPEGKRDPLAELRANLSLFLHHPEREHLGLHGPQPVLCAFPERAHWLSQMTGLSFKAVTCSDFEEWKSGMNADGVTLVFSSSYPNNPASMFGHTLLRLNSQRTSKALLDYGINFAAYTPDGESGIFYTILGLIGGYPGFYSLAPYYMKVNEYVHSDSRDLWEYNLHLDPDAIARLVRHLWELYGNALFDYYFMDENCSYQLLTLLEVARPDWNLVDQFRTFVLPADTVKAVVDQKDATDSIQFRPSIRKQLEQKVAGLSAEEEKQLAQVLKTRTVPQNLAPADRYWVDTAIASLSAAKHRKAAQFQTTDQVLLDALLVERAKLGSSDGARTPAEMDQGNQPDLGHHSSRIGLWFEHPLGTGPAALGMQYRMSLHDLLSSDLGYETGSQFEFLRADLEIPLDQPKLKLRELLLADITSLPEFVWEDPEVSWGLQAKGARPRWYDRSDAMALSAQGSFGLSTGMPELLHRSVVSFLLTGRLDYSADWGPSHWAFWFGGEFIQVFQFAAKWKALFKERLTFAPLQPDWSGTVFEFRPGVSYTFSRAWEVRSELEWVQSDFLRNKSEGGIRWTIHHYF